MQRSLATVLLVAICFALPARPLMAQEGSIGQSFDALSARLEQQDQQIRQMQAQLNAMQQQQQQGTSAIPAAYATGGTAAAAPAKPADAVVGSDLNITAKFWNGEGLMFSTPNKDFTFHLGGWMQWDNVWWNQSPSLKNSPFGTLSDGDYFRRVRVVMEGTFWETFEYRWNYVLDNNSFNTVGLDEFWVGANKIPLVGTLRGGHIKDPLGLEGDMSSSSRCMTFMERSSYSESIELNQTFVTGLWMLNTAFDDRLFWSGAIFRTDNANSGDYFGTGQYGVQGRLTGLPIYEDEGRQLLHLGLSGGWRSGSASAPGGADSIRLSARPELRDDDPASSGPPPVGAIPNYFLPNANNSRLIDTGSIAISDDYLLGTELLYIRGPWSLQAEYGWNFVNAMAAGKGVANYIFNGGYVQTAYTLTGENRGYDKKTGTLSRYYFGNQGPYENAFIVRDADGGICSGRGAWELAGRFSYVDLNSGSDSHVIHGGIMNGLSLGLNWYLNLNITVNTEWSYNNVYDSGTLPNGWTSGFGTRVQLSF